MCSIRYIYFQNIGQVLGPDVDMLLWTRDKSGYEKKLKMYVHLIVFNFNEF